MNPSWQFSAYETHEFQPKSAEYCVCVFVINEGERLHNQLKRMESLASDIDIVIVDGGSSDGSTDHLVLQGYGVNTLLVKTGEGRLGAQMRMAFAWALNRGYKGVVVIDGNNKDGVQAIPDFITELAAGMDHVQGSRFIKGGHHEHTPLIRLLGLKLLHAPLMRLVSGFPYTDTTNGFRAYSAALLKDERVAVFRDGFTGYELHYYLALKAAKLGFKCVEIPVSRVYPLKGKIPTNISPIKGNIQVLKKLFITLMGKYDPS